MFFWLLVLFVSSLLRIVRTSTPQLLLASGLVSDRSAAPVLDIPAWDPRTYSDPSNLNNTIARGLNVLNAISGCHIASWVFVGKRPKGDCESQPLEKQINSHWTFVRENDTIYVPFDVLTEFADYVSNLTTDFVLISSRFQHFNAPPSFATSVTKILGSPHLVHWFISDMGIYSGGNQQNPKVRRKTDTSLAFDEIAHCEEHTPS